MVRRLSRAQRKAAFLRQASVAFEELDKWYDEHPQATFGEIEQEARKKRRELMGKALEILINGHGTGAEEVPGPCAQCGAEMKLRDYRRKKIRGLEGDSALERAYYVCSQRCGETIFPLDEQLQLRRDRWSDGAARVITQQGMRAPSFAEAAADYRRAVGGTVSADSARRLTEGFGHATIALRTAEVQKVYDLEQGDIGSIEPIAPIAGQANISTDGTMILVRGEGWKEVKLTVISRCEIIDTEKGRKVKLDEHSCQAGLWDADTMARHQYLEGLRRGLIACEKLSSVNDAAPWIGRITQDNFPHVVLIVDWPHAKQRLFTVAHELFGEGSEAATAWAEGNTDLLWQGDVAAITSALKAFPDNETACRAQSYFEGHAEQMEYARFRQEGYPVGSGTAESGGKNYVQRRMKRPGPGWNRDTGQAMLSGLSELHSGRFDAVWEQCA